MKKIAKKVATILLVKEIEPCLDFWTKTLGFEVTQSVPEGDKLGFAMLAQGDIEIHLQTKSVTKKGLPSLAIGEPVSAVVYFDVENIDELETSLSARQDIEILVPKHKTFYGATEIYVREPGGHMLGFAQL